MWSRIRTRVRPKNPKPSVIRHPSLVIFYLSLFISFLLLFPSSTSSQEGKIGYVDSMRLRAEFEEFAEAQAKFDQEVKIWQEELDQMANLIDSLVADSAKYSLVLSEVRRKEKNDYLKSKRLEYNKLTNDIFGPNGRVEKKNVELTKPILDKINMV
ncbi:MAG: OmpH family outer membrane protein, partial [Candidatus Zixiibacteriota bacterium]